MTLLSLPPLLSLAVSCSPCSLVSGLIVLLTPRFKQSLVIVLLALHVYKLSRDFSAQY